MHFKILLCVLFVPCFADFGHTSLELSNLTIYIVEYDIKIVCMDYNSLDNIDEMNLAQTSDTIPVSIIFENCFNNETEHGNYRNFSIRNIMKKFQRSADFSIQFEEYGLIDNNVFYRDDNLSHYKLIKLTNVGCDDTKFLQVVNSKIISLNNINQVDFDDFGPTTTTFILILSNLHISHFTGTNLAKFRGIRILELYDFSFIDDSNVLNVPNLFAANTNLRQIYLINSSTRILLHEAVFNGLTQLVSLQLKHLNIDYLPMNLFHGLSALASVYLHGNSFKMLDPNSFTSNPLLFLSIDGGFILESRTPIDLVLAQESMIQIGHVTIDSYSTIAELIQNSNIKYIEIAESNLMNVSIADFNQIRSRLTTLQIFIANSNLKFTFAELRAKQINFDTFAILKSKDFNAVIEISWTLMKCPQCVFDFEMFMLYADGKFEGLNILLNDAQVLFKLHMNFYTQLEQFYTIPYTENCPALCKCRHNPLLDDITIDCTNRGLKAIPIISWPSQFTKIDTIVLDMSENTLRSISFANQDHRVVQHLSKVNFKNNFIEIIEISDVPALLSQVIPCVLTPDFTRTSNVIVINGVPQNDTKPICSLKNSIEKDTLQYIRKKSPESIKYILDAMPCDMTCDV